MGKYFGTDGFRGEAGIDLTADHAYKRALFNSRTHLPSQLNLHVKVGHGCGQQC